jgi:hypothetical protein
MIAASRLQALIDSRAGQTSMAEILYKLDRIINAVHAVVAEELWPEILRKIHEPEAADTPMDELDDCDDAEDAYDPVESADAEEDCWRATARRDQPLAGCGAGTRTTTSPVRGIRVFTPETVTDEDDI